MKRVSGGINVPIGLASLVIAIMLWVVVLPQQLSQQLTRRVRPFNIKLLPVNLDPKFVLDKMPDQVTVSAKVSDQEYNDLKATVLSAEVDFSSASAGTRRYPVSIYPPRFEKMIKPIAPTVVCAIENLIKRDLPVTAIGTGRLSDPGLLLDDMKLEPKKVMLSGPAKDVSRVVRVQATLRLDMVDAHAPQPAIVDLEPFDVDNHIVSNVELRPSNVIITPKISPTPQSKPLFVDPKFVGKVMDGFTVTGYTVDPDRVIASGPSRVLSGLAKIATVPIDLSQLKGAQSVTVLLVIPPGVTGVDVQAVHVTIKVEPVTVKGLNSPLPNLKGNGIGKTGAEGVPPVGAKGNSH